MALKDLTLGAELRETAGRAGLTCVGSETMVPLCFSIRGAPPDLDTIAGATTTEVRMAGDGDGRVGRVSFAFRSSGFPLVRAAVLERYPALRCRDSVVENAMGAKFDQTICTHTAANGDQMTVQRRAQKVTDGEVSIESAAFREALRRAYEKRKEAGKKDIKGE